MKKTLLILGAILISFAAIFAQTKKSVLPNQLKKGKWQISTNVIEIGPVNIKSTSYDPNGNVKYTDVQKLFDINLFLKAPNWGDISFANISYTSADANNVQQTKSSEDNLNLLLRPSAGYFIKNRLLVGAQLELILRKYSGWSLTGSNSNETKINRTGFGIGPEVRYYFGNISSKKIFHAGLSLSAGTSSFTQNNTQTVGNAVTTTKQQSKYRYLGLSPYVGYTKLIGRHWLLEPVLFARMNWSESESEMITKIANNNTTTLNSLFKIKNTQFVRLALRVGYTL